MVAASGFANYLAARASDTGAPLGAGRTDTLRRGQEMRRGQQLISKNGRAKLIFQTDGNLVLYGDGRRLWDAGSTGRGTMVALQTDGSLVVYQGGTAIWNENHPDSDILAVQDDGNMVLYNRARRPLWSTTTNGFNPYDGRSWLEKAGSTVAAVADIASSVVSLVPGVGTVAGGVLGAVAAVGRGESIADIAVGAARGALPGGPAAKVAFDIGIGIAKGQNVTGLALSTLRNQIPGGDIGKAAFDAALAVAYHAKPHEAAAAARALPKGKARETFARPVLVAAKVRKAPPAALHRIIRKERALTRARPISARARSFLGRAIRTHAKKRLDTQGLNPDGKSYTVERGDSAWRIAQNLTGDGNKHYQELLRANSPPKALVRDGMTLAPGASTAGANFKYLNAGEKLKIPASWIGTFVKTTAQAPPPPPGGDALSLPAPKAAPVAQPPPAAPASTAPAVVIPASLPTPPPPVTDPAKLPPIAERDDPVAIAQAKSILVAWEHTDGSAAAGLPDYGGNASDTSPIWGPRDSWELRAFTVWSNAHGTTLSLLGDLTQAKLDALVAWAENRAKQLATGQGSVSPTGLPDAAPAGGNTVVAPGPSPIQTAAGTSVLPSGAAPQTVQAGVIPTELIPETSISGSTKKEGSGFGFGIAAMALLGIGVVLSSGDAKNHKKRAA